MFHHFLEAIDWQESTMWKGGHVKTNKYNATTRIAESTTILPSSHNIAAQHHYMYTPAPSRHHLSKKGPLIAANINCIIEKGSFRDSVCLGDIYDLGLNDGFYTV